MQYTSRGVRLVTPALQVDGIVDKTTEDGSGGGDGGELAVNVVDLLLVDVRTLLREL